MGKGRGTGPGAKVAMVAALPAYLLAASVATALADSVAPESAAEPVVLGFDDYPAEVSGAPAAAAVASHYADRGVVFGEGVTALRFNDKSFPPGAEIPRSPEVALTSCYAREFCVERIGMTFSRPLTALALHLGAYASLTSPEDVELTTLDDSGNVVARSTVTLPASAGPQPVRQLIEVSDPDGRISVASVTAETPGVGLLLDDLVMTPFLAAARLSAAPPEVVSVDGEAETVPVTVTNDGGLAVGGAVVDFEVLDQQPPTQAVAAVEVGEGDCPTGLDPGASCTLEVRVEPALPGTLAGRIVVRETLADESASDVRELLVVPVSVRVPEEPPTPPTPAEETTAVDEPTRGSTTPEAEPTREVVPPGSAAQQPGPPQSPVRRLAETVAAALSSPQGAALALFTALLVAVAAVRRLRWARAAPTEPAAVAGRPRVAVRPDAWASRLHEPRERRPGLGIRCAAPSTTMREEPT